MQLLPRGLMSRMALSFQSLKHLGSAWDRRSKGVAPVRCSTSLVVLILAIFSCLFALRNCKHHPSGRSLFLNVPLYPDRLARGNRSEVLTIYEQYHGREAWPALSQSDDPVFRGLSQKQGEVRPESNDIDAPKLLPLLKDPYYQDLLCEYGGFFTIDKHLSKVHRTPWLGFQSWRASKKGFALSPVAVRQLEGALRDEIHGINVLYFWSYGNNESKSIHAKFYPSCNQMHGGNCTLFYATVLSRTLHHQRHLAPPPMPTTGLWAYMSYWAMTKEAFSDYIKFARMVFVVLDGLNFQDHHDLHKCSLTPIEGNEYFYRHCWCFYMERLVNIWAYHSGLHMVYVDSATGEMQEQHPVLERNRWFDVFGRKSMAALKANMSAILDEFPHGRALYQSLGGSVGSW